jgi:hypothetical protein
VWEVKKKFARVSSSRKSNRGAMAGAKKIENGKEKIRSKDVCMCVCTRMGQLKVHEEGTKID